MIVLQMVFLACRKLTSRLGVSSQKFQCSGSCYRLSAAMHIEFAVDVVDVPFDRADGDEELLCDLAI